MKTHFAPGGGCLKSSYPIEGDNTHRTAASTAIVLRTLCAAAVLACCATAQAQWVEPALQANVSPTSREAQDARFREAMHMHKIGRWSAAYGRFAVLADEGYAPA